MDTRITHALKFAIKAHGDQKRKYTGEPYTVHLIEVCELVASVLDDPEVLQAALLHDVLEDTQTGIDHLTREFGVRVTSMVVTLTDTPKFMGNRAFRKAKDRERLEMASGPVQTIKLADLISNTTSIVEHDPDFARAYLREKALLLKVLTRGDQRLLHRAQFQLEQAFNALKRTGT